MKTCTNNDDLGSDEEDELEQLTKILTNEKMVNSQTLANSF
jgi:hypothetical protein